MFESYDIIFKCGIHVKVTEQSFPVVLFVILYKVALTLASLCNILKLILTIQVKASEQHLSMFLFVFLPVRVIIWLRPRRVNTTSLKDG